jgi:hypothetical protein
METIALCFEITADNIIIFWRQNVIFLLLLNLVVYKLNTKRQYNENLALKNGCLKVAPLHIISYLLTAIRLLPGGSGYFTCKQIWKEKVTRKFKSGGLHERHVVTTWKLGNHLSIHL